MNFIAGAPKGDTLVRFVYEGELGGLKDAAKANNFSGRERELFVATEKKTRLIVAGLGKKDKFGTEKLRRAAAAAGQRARALDLAEISVDVPAGDRAENTQAAVEGIALALYEYKRFKSRNNKPLRLHTVRVDGDPDAVRRGEIYARATCLTRDLVNDPPSVCTPRYLADAAKRVAKKGVSVKVFDEKQIAKMKMGGVQGVAIGSTEPARFVHLQYRAPGARKTIAIVGKGITFDSGGLCLKPADGMLNMKDDMSGAGAVIGVFSALSELKPRVNVHGIFAATENMPGGSAYKTRDVLRAMNGKTMEIINTDAEGRLILADALSYASRLKPTEIIDLATLTGACVVALGPEISAIFTASDKIQKGLLAAAKSQGEKLWPLPLENEYLEMIKSDVADMKNSGGRWGGAITAALFLREFVDEGIPWAHLDIAGPALVESDRPYRPAGGTGVMVRTLLRYLEEQ
ncbi:MAG: leucyl aminopeptidase [Planctomycetaceae bacterium]|nr:leucyl aminopeptidase [Planctomycetaceae bacterium]